MYDFAIFLLSCVLDGAILEFYSTIVHFTTLKDILSRNSICKQSCDSTNPSENETKKGGVLGVKLTQLCPTPDRTFSSPSHVKTREKQKARENE